MTPREVTQALEQEHLSPFAARSRQTKGRERPEEECPLRTPYQRDRDRILHCKSFRRLKHKTQVFLAPEGDHYRTRLTHTLEVAQIARTIARALQLNEDLTEAISLGHDLGHTPFGHAGERALNEVSPLGFRHYEQSVRVVERLEKEGEGLNLTWEVRDGILCHTCGQEAATMEGRIVRLADRIAYINHDIDDAIRGGVLTEEDIPQKVRAVLGGRHSARIGTLIQSVVEHSTGGVLQMQPQVADAFSKLHTFMYDRVYFNSRAKAEEGKAEDLIKRLYEYFTGRPQKLPGEFAAICETEGKDRATLDYIAGMSDYYAIETFQRLFVPKGWGG